MCNTLPNIHLNPQGFKSFPIIFIQFQNQREKTKWLQYKFISKEHSSKWVSIR